MLNEIRIAVDAMGGEGSPKKTIDGVINHFNKNKKVFYKIFGDEAKIKNIIGNKIPSDNYAIINTTDIVKDNDSPLSAAKKKDTSMFKAIESVKNKESDVAISAGNTGALFVIAKLNLKMINSINKPALSGLWPNKKGFNIVLDLGANIQCDEKDMLDFSIMGASLYKSLFPTDDAKVALLNIGSEEMKGNDIVKNSYQLITKHNQKLFEFKGYVEGNNIMNGDVNVIVTDGFTGNIALKTAEGTANFITEELKKALSSSFLSKFLSFLNIRSLKKFKNKLDPRKYNGAILIGLDSPVIKSHGSTDFLGFSNSLDVCEKIVKNKLIDKIKENIHK
jgi:glycerol-3-phosphate acyltransferase PlsX|tara:strand:+ start:1251 stop:2255 length:1005 start_codon:yes stop_codon:yes gene_type:complete